MVRLVNKVSDRMLGIFAPKVEASACSPQFIGCCDWKVCMFYCPGRPTWCAGCSGPRCA